MGICSETKSGWKRRFLADANSVLAALLAHGMHIVGIVLKKNSSVTSTKINVPKSHLKWGHDTQPKKYGGFDVRIARHQSCHIGLNLED